MATNNSANAPIDLWDRSVAVTAGGSQTWSKSRGVVGPWDGFPLFATGGSGSILTLLDGSEVVDLAGANATAALGYNRPEVIAAVSKVLGVGGTLSLPTKSEVEVSEAMIAAVPYGNVVRWVRSGSEAVSGAVKCARQLTNRRKVLRFNGSYHGWHPWIDEADSIAQHDTEGNLSVPKVLGPYAAVIVEPPRFKEIDEPYIDWLSDLASRCYDSQTALIYDDVVYGFRFKTGGLQEETDVPPDMACFSKALGNGVPIGCVVGHGDWMTEQNMPVSSTFGGEQMGLAAAGAVLGLHKSMDVCTALKQLGVELRSILDKALKSSLIKVEGTPVHFRFVVRDTEPTDQHRGILDRFLVGALDNGVLIHRHANNINLGMSDLSGGLQMIGNAVRKAAKLTS
jgi:glutamate-1-semialdehyde 2,1-aminomutase